MSCACYDCDLFLGWDPSHKGGPKKAVPDDPVKNTVGRLKIRDPHNPPRGDVGCP